MIDRDELLRFRIENYLDTRGTRLQKVRAGVSTLAVREASDSHITVGAFATSKHEYKHGNRHHFIETPIPGSSDSRQLWLPAQQWEQPFRTVPQREIVMTVGQSARRFAEWQDVRPSIADLDGYLPYDPENQAIFDEAKLTLQYIDANDDGFEFSVEQL